MTADPRGAAIRGKGWRGANVRRAAANCGPGVRGRTVPCCRPGVLFLGDRRRSAEHRLLMIEELLERAVDLIRDHIARP